LQYDWDYASEPEPRLSGKRVYLPRGKVLGGSSSMNAMIYIRGSRADYDGWAAGGAKGWSYNEVLPISSRLRLTSAARTSSMGVSDRFRSARDVRAIR